MEELRYNIKVDIMRSYLPKTIKVKNYSEILSGNKHNENTLRDKMDRGKIQFWITYNLGGVNYAFYPIAYFWKGGDSIKEVAYELMKYILELISPKV